jgi:hypothetical protein
MPAKDKLYFLLFLFGFALLLFNFPILGLFGGPVRLAGIPLLYVFIFAAWLLIIVLTAVLVNRPTRRHQ